MIKTPTIIETAKASAISEILKNANGSWKDIAEEGYDAGFEAAAAQLAQPAPQPGKHKPFIVANVKEIIELMDSEEVSFSRGVEMLNEVAAKYYGHPAQEGYRQVASDAWDAADNCANERSMYPYGKRSGKYDHPDKETYLSSLPAPSAQPEGKRDYTKFFTPHHIASFMVGLVNPKVDDVVLEPSAGNGSIVRAIKQYNAGVKVFAFDINEDFKPFLRNAGANIVVIKDFLEIPVYAKFTSCVANPPFGNGIDLQAHFNHICNHVKDGGKIVLIVPQDFTPTIPHETIPIENWSKNSDGTITPIKIIHFTNNSEASAQVSEAVDIKNISQQGEQC